MTHPHSTLVVGSAWVGDMVMCHSLIQQIKSATDTRIAVLAPLWTLPLVSRMPGVDRGIELPFAHGEMNFPGRFRLAKSLRKRHFSQALVLPGSWKSALIPALAGIPQRIGYLGEQRWLLLTEPRKLDKIASPTTVQRFAALASPAGVPVPKLADLPWPRLRSTATTQAKALRALDFTAPTKPVLGLCPGAEFGPSKQWPAEHYATVAREFSRRGWSIWLFGSGRDAAFAQQIEVQSVVPTTNLCGKTSLLQAIDMLALCQAVVSNDSGLMHIAAALQRPLVALYGSSSPDTTPPLGTSCVLLRRMLDCSPCFKRQCPLQHHHCLQKLVPQQVIEALEQLPKPPEHASADH